MFDHCGLLPQKQAAWDMLNTLEMKTMEQTSRVSLVLSQHLLYTCGKSSVLGGSREPSNGKIAEKDLGDTNLPQDCPTTHRCL